jgi:protein CpxP
MIGRLLTSGLTHKTTKKIEQYMKLTKATFLAALTATGLLACGQAFAQDSTTPATPGTPSTGTSTNAAPHMRGRGPSLDRIEKALNLTDDEKPKVQPILESWHSQTMAVFQDSSLSRDDRQTKLKSIHDDITAKLQPILTADQMATWQKVSQPRRRPAAPATPPAPAAGQ